MTRPAPAPPHLHLSADRPLTAGITDPRPLEHLTASGLTMQERAVYEVLAAHCGRVLSRAELARRAGLSDLSARRCDALIVGIRRAIGPDRVRTVRRRGWMLAP